MGSPTGYAGNGNGTYQRLSDGSGPFKYDGTNISNVSEPFYRLFVPISAVGASKFHFDLWNDVGSGKTLKIYSILPWFDGTVAVVGVVAVAFLLNRTTTIGTGGTASTVESSSFSAPNFTAYYPTSPALPSQITSRRNPTGGGTLGAAITIVEINVEETLAVVGGSYNTDMITRGKSCFPPLAVPENSGIAVNQSGVASVGSVGFDVIFSCV